MSVYRVEQNGCVAAVGLAIALCIAAFGQWLFWPFSAREWKIIGLAAIYYLFFGLAWDFWLGEKMLSRMPWHRKP